MNVFGYLRVSGKGQLEGDGFPRQEAAVRAFCTAHGLTLQGWFHEKGVSGTVDGLDRPAFSDLLFQVAEPLMPGIPISAIVVERMDRLARDLMVSEVLLAECRKRQLKVFSADQGTTIDMASDGGDPTRVLIRQIMGALAQWEKSNLVKKLRAARDRVRAKTGRCEGPKPFGQTVVERDFIGMVLHIRSTGVSIQGIADMLNEQGFPNKKSPTGVWKKEAVAEFLRRHGRKET